MRVLMKIPDSILTRNLPAAKLARELFSIVSYHYNEECGDSEAYLQVPANDENLAEDMALLNGRYDPDKITAMAKEWNNQLAEDFERVLAQALATQACPGSARWLTIPSPQIYELKKAIMALDNDFYAFAEQALLVNSKYITTRLQAEELNDILAHPDSYATITVHPK